MILVNVTHIVQATVYFHNRGQLLVLNTKDVR